MKIDQVKYAGSAIENSKENEKPWYRLFLEPDSLERIPCIKLKDVKGKSREYYPLLLKERHTKTNDLTHSVIYNTFYSDGKKDNEADIAFYIEKEKIKNFKVGNNNIIVIISPFADGNISKADFRVYVNPTEKKVPEENYIGKGYVINKGKKMNIENNVAMFSIGAGFYDENPKLIGGHVLNATFNQKAIMTRTGKYPFSYVHFIATDNNPNKYGAFLSYTENLPKADFSFKVDNKVVRNANINELGFFKVSAYFKSPDAVNSQNTMYMCEYTTKEQRTSQKPITFGDGACALESIKALYGEKIATEKVPKKKMVEQEESTSKIKIIKKGVNI